MYLGLLRAGHEVRTYIDDPQWRCILRGFLRLTDDWRRELDWVRDGDGIIVFERADQGELQDLLRRDGFNVIGGSAFGDRLENDRLFGQSCMRQAGMKTAPVRAFTNFDAAIAFILDRRYRGIAAASQGVRCAGRSARLHPHGSPCRSRSRHWGLFQRRAVS
jgi:phosphoribosylamine--glycine ligase